MKETKDYDYLMLVGLFIIFVGAGTSDCNMTNTGLFLGLAIAICGLIVMALSRKEFRIWLSQKLNIMALTFKNFKSPNWIKRRVKIIKNYLF